MSKAIEWGVTKAKAANSAAIYVEGKGMILNRSRGAEILGDAMHELTHIYDIKSEKHKWLRTPDQLRGRDFNAKELWRLEMRAHTAQREWLLGAGMNLPDHLTDMRSIVQHLNEKYPGARP